MSNELATHEARAQHGIIDRALPVLVRYEHGVTIEQMSAPDLEAFAELLAEHEAA